MSHEKEPQEKARPPEKKRKIVRTDQLLPGWIWITFTVICLALFISSCRKAKKEADKQVKAVARENARTNPPPARIVTQRPRVPRTMDVPQEGLRLWLEEAPAIYPKLGGIKVGTPSGRSYIDLPGIDHYPGYEPAGWYTFHPEPQGKRREVQIYNRW